MNGTRTYWFGRKRIGWGLSPRTWQGWVTIAVYCILMIASSQIFAADTQREMDIAIKIVLTGALFAIFAWKYDPSGDGV